MDRDNERGIVNTASLCLNTDRWQNKGKTNSVLIELPWAVRRASMAQILQVSRTREDEHSSTQIYSLNWCSDDGSGEQVILVAENTPLQ